VKQQSVALVVVTTVLGTTGGDRWLYVLEDRWTDLGVEVTHLHITGSSRSEAPMPSTRVRVVQGSRSDRRARSDIVRVLMTMWREIRRADVVLLEPQGLSAPIAFLLAKLIGRPSAIYSQGIADLSFEIWEPNKLHRALVRFMWRHVDAVMCVSPGSVRAALRQRVARDKVVEVHTAVDVDEIRRRAAGAPGRPPSGRPLVVGCGTVSAHKGFDRVVLAVSELKERGVVVDLLIVGPPGDDVERVSSLVESHGLAERVAFVSHGPDAAPYIAQADVFVHAARYDTVPLVLLEALALGVPVIALDEAAGGPRLVLDDGAHGRVLDADASPHEFADALQAHLDNPEELRSRAANSETYVRQEFSVPQAAEVSARLLCRLGGRGRELTVAPSSA
jgi:glycosyltransferase involved in cell wall biosynthesis